MPCAVVVPFRTIVCVRRAVAGQSKTLELRHEDGLATTGANALYQRGSRL